jgi:hypothetical protein
MFKLGMKKDQILPILIGSAAFILFFGLSPLNPSEISWLWSNDFLQSYLGWEFFRESQWENPIGLNPRYGYDISSSIVYSDSIPLFAILFKVIASLLPSPFQYFGLWMLCCYVFQSLISWKIIGIYTQSNIYKALITIVLLFSPAMLWRLNMTHFALAGHFIILAAIYLNLINKTSRSYMWGAIVLGAALIHFYLLFIVYFLYIGNLFDLISRNKKIALLSVEFITINILLILFAWQAGYFTIPFGSISHSTFGNYSTNLLSIFDSRDYSIFLNGIPQKNYYDEGFNYIGAGGIFLLLVSLPSIWKCKGDLLNKLIEKKCFVIILFILLLLSLTHKISFGNLNIEVYFPSTLISFLGFIRCSGRLFWPIYYLLLIIPAVLIFRTNTKLISTVVFCVAATLQFIDISPLKQKIQNNITTSTYSHTNERLLHPFWNVAAENYDLLLARPTGSFHSSWHVFGNFAANHNIATNIVCLARVDEKKVLASQESFDNAIYKGITKKKALYVIEDMHLWKLSYNKLPLIYDSTSDLLVNVDGYTILAPGWKNCSECLRLDTSLIEFTKSKPVVVKGQKIMFDSLTSISDNFLLGGWYDSEAWGVWAKDAKANAVFPIPSSDSKHLVLEVRAFVSDAYKLQEIEVYSKDKLLLKQALSTFDGNKLYIPISAAMHRDGFIAIEIKSINPVKTSDVIAASKDTRMLSIGLVSALFP